MSAHPSEAQLAAGGDGHVAFQQAFQQALRRGAGQALAVVGRDGRLLYLSHSEPPPGAGSETARAGRLRQWLAAPEWISDLLASEAFARAASEGLGCRGAAIDRDAEIVLEQTITPLAVGDSASPMLVVMREMSEWRRYASGIERLSRFYEVMLNTVAEGILGIGTTGAIEFANPAAAALLGWPSEDLIGQPALAVLGADIGRAAADGRPHEVLFARRGGLPFVAEYRCAENGDDDAPCGIVMAFSDIGVRKAAEDDLRDSNRRLQETLHALEATQRRLFQSEKLAAVGQLAAGIAHGINNPIAYIGANLGMLETYAGDLLAATAGPPQPQLEAIREDLPALLAETRQGVEGIVRLVKSLRAFAQVDRVEEWGELDLRTGVDSALCLLGHEIQGRVEVVNEIGELPPVDCQIAQINQIFLKLLSNAVRAVGEGGEGGVVRIGGGCADDCAWVEIADNGCGMTPEQRQRLFLPFFTTRAIGEGAGLGLAVAYGIARSHGGELSVDSEPGRGTTFRLTLPIKRADV